MNMSKLDIADHDERQRDPVKGEYLINAVACGQIVCCRPGITLIDMYRTMGVLAKDVKPQPQEPTCPPTTK